MAKHGIRSLVAQQWHGGRNCKVRLLLLISPSLVVTPTVVRAFSVTARSISNPRPRQLVSRRLASDFDQELDSGRIDAGEDGEEEGAKINTVNDRLLAELETAAQREVSGTSSSSLRNPADLMRSLRQPRKTDEERLEAIEEARNLNGINPLVPLTAAVVALAGSFGLWLAFDALADYWFSHLPPDDAPYALQRLASLVRNVTVGLVVLGCGFCGVVGLGLALLGLRVTAGVVSGELDPTPLPSATTKLSSLQQDDDWTLPSAWDLMRGKTGRRGKR